MIRISHVYSVLVFSALFLNIATPSSAAQLDATWICTDSAFHEWTDPACWNLGGAMFPDNDATNTFHVIVDSNQGWNSKVYLPGSPWIDVDSLVVGSGDTVRVDAGYLSVYDNGPGTGIIVNNGTIELDSGGDFVYLYYGPDLDISGVGDLVLTGHINNRLYGVGSATLTNRSGHTIRGGGSVGDFSVIINEGIIDANLSGYDLLLNPREDEDCVNDGTLRATSGGNLLLASGTWDNSSGVIRAASNGIVTIFNASVTGGLVASSQGGVVHLDHHLADATVSGLLRVFRGSFEGTITNQGTINLDDNPGSWVILKIVGDTELNGGGDLVVFPSIYQYIEGETGAERLTNRINHTIKGASTIGRDKLAFTNFGLIVANEPSLAMTVDGVDSLSNINNGTLRATAGADLVLKDTTWQNAGGVIEALNISWVDIVQSTIEGGVLHTVGTGEIGLRWQSHLDGVTNNGYLYANSNGSVDTTYLHGITINNGLIEINNNMHLVCDGTYLPSWQSLTVLQPLAFFEMSTTTTMEGTLRGEGKFQGDIELAGNGWLDPGLPTGTLRTYDLTIEDGAHYRWQIDADAADLVDVQGLLDFGTAHLYVTPAVLGGTIPDTIVLFEYDQLQSVPTKPQIILSAGFDYQGISTANNRITLTGVTFEPEIFSHGFEGGGTGAWSATVQ